MVDICEFLEVKAKLSDDDIVIENCGDYNGALDGFMLALEPDKIPLLQEWVQRNVRNNAKHCLKMLETNTESTFKFLMRMRSIDNCTSEFVTAVGGIQQFLDKYSEIENPEEQPAKSIDEEHVQDEEELSQETESESSASTSDGIAEDEVHTFSEMHENVDVTNTPDDTETTGDSEQEPHTNEEESVPEQKVVRTEIIVRQVKNVMEYDPELIEKISDGQIEDSLKKLKELNDAIALGGLDPNLVLNDADLEAVYKKIYTYPPDVFKSFFLAYLKSGASETERFRISSVVDDFLSFVTR